MPVGSPTKEHSARAPACATRDSAPPLDEIDGAAHLRSDCPGSGGQSAEWATVQRLQIGQLVVVGRDPEENDMLFRQGDLLIQKVEEIPEGARSTEAAHDRDGVRDRPSASNQRTQIGSCVLGR